MKLKEKMVLGEGFRMTSQRQAILDAVRQLRHHPTAKEVFREVRKELPAVSFGTVYRNLDFLVKNSMIKELTFGDGAAKFDGMLHDHHHFVCDRCGAIINLEIPGLTTLAEGIKKKNRLTGYRLDFYGICDHCID